MTPSRGLCLACALCILSCYSARAGKLLEAMNLKEALPKVAKLSTLNQLLTTTGILGDAYLNGGQKWEATLFAPTNAAIDKLLKSDPSLAKDTAKLQQVLYYHFVPGYRINKPDAEMPDGFKLPTLLTRLNGRSQLTVSKVGKTVSLKTETQQTVAFGVDFFDAGDMKVYLIDSVLLPNTASAPGPLLPPPKVTYSSFGNALLTTPGLEYFSYLVNQAGLTAYFNNPALKGTLFVPNHKAIQYIVKDFKLKGHADFTADTARLSCILKAHFVPGTISTKAQLQASKGKLLATATPGTSLTVSLYKEHTVMKGPVNKGKTLRYYPQCLKTVMKCESGTKDTKIGAAPNGYIYVIDHYIIPAKC